VELMNDYAALKSGNRQEAKECLEMVARGLVKTEYKLRPMEDLTRVSADR
jgi:propanol-preferring alcohol dehydrogenase